MTTELERKCRSIRREMNARLKLSKDNSICESYRQLNHGIALGLEKALKIFKRKPRTRRTNK